MRGIQALFAFLALLVREEVSSSRIPSYVLPTCQYVLPDAGLGTQCGGSLEAAPAYTESLLRSTIQSVEITATGDQPGYSLQGLPLPDAVNVNLLQCTGNDTCAYDAPFPKSCCTYGFSCDRNDTSRNWQCMPESTPSYDDSQGCKTKYSAYDQCGGSGGQCMGNLCQTVLWPLSCCPDGFECVQGNSSLWRCLPATSPVLPTEFNSEILVTSGSSYGIASSVLNLSYTSWPARRPGFSIAVLMGQAPLELFSQCGGVGGTCSQIGECLDNPYPDMSCPAGSGCQRQNQYYWQCMPTSLPFPPPPPPVLPLWAQCGGTSGHCATFNACKDAPFPGFNCTADAVCTRETVFFWQCQPLNTLGTPSPQPSPPPPSSPTQGTPSPGPVPGPPPPVTGPTFVGKSPPPVNQNGPDYVDSTTGQIVELKGFSYFGFNNGQTMVDGDTTMVADFSTIVYRQQLLGFNCVRLSFTFSDLNLAPKNWTKPCTVTSNAALEVATLDATLDLNLSSLHFPAQVAPALAYPFPPMCNEYLPSGSTLERFLWVIQFYVGNGFYVALDFHPLTGDPNPDSADLFVQNWSTLWQAIVGLPTFEQHLKGRILLDLFNEPDGFGILWDTVNYAGRPSLQDLYSGALQATYGINPAALYWLEGTGQLGLQTNFGDGFATDPTVIANLGLSNPRPFFDDLIKQPWVTQVALAPHVYPPSVTGQTAFYEGAGLWNRLSTSFGLFNTVGYSGFKFPIVIGEFGSRLIGQTDLDWMRDFTLWLNNEGSASDGLHGSVGNLIWWDWNANSGDTGGLLDDAWTNVVWPKIQALTQLGLRPWYLQS